MAARALVFDLDGTVWDSRPWYAALLGGEDADAVSDSLEALRAGRPVARLLRDAGITRSGFRRLCGEAAKCQLYPGVPETIEELARRGTALGTATNLPAWIAQPMVATLGLEAITDALVTWGSTRQHKSQAAPLLEALRLMGEEPGEDVWYVGDDASDLRAAEAAGLSFAWASFGYGTIDRRPRVALKGFDEVLSL